MKRTLVNLNEEIFSFEHCEKSIFYIYIHQDQDVYLWRMLLIIAFLTENYVYHGLSPNWVLHFVPERKFPSVKIFFSFEKLRIGLSCARLYSTYTRHRKHFIQLCRGRKMCYALSLVFSRCLHLSVEYCEPALKHVRGIFYREKLFSSRSVHKII